MTEQMIEDVGGNISAMDGQANNVQQEEKKLWEMLMTIRGYRRRMNEEMDRLEEAFEDKLSLGALHRQIIQNLVNVSSHTAYLHMNLAFDMKIK